MLTFTCILLSSHIERGDKGEKSDVAADNTGSQVRTAFGSKNLQFCCLLHCFICHLHSCSHINDAFFAEHGNALQGETGRCGTLFTLCLVDQVGEEREEIGAILGGVAGHHLPNGHCLCHLPLCPR